MKLQFLVHRLSLTTAGRFMEKYKHLTFIYAFLMSAISSVLNGTMPFYGNVNIFLGLGFVRGFLFTAVYSGELTNVSSFHNTQINAMNVLYCTFHCQNSLLACV